MKQIVVLGGGFGGLRAARLIARSLRRKRLHDRYRVILIDRNTYQTYTPTLYEAATTSQDTANYCALKNIITFPIVDLLAFESVEFVHDTVTELDLIHGDVHCVGRRLRFDYLVLALGSETNYFNIPGLEECALPLKTFVDAMRIRDRVLALQSDRGTSAQIVIGGGGSTGVELAGELEVWLCTLGAERRRFCTATVTVVDGGNRLLGNLDKRIGTRAFERLNELGVSIVLAERIVGVDRNTVIFQSGKKIPYDLLIWTGGVKAPSIMSSLPLKGDGRRVTVMSEMQCFPHRDDLVLYGRIYALGDAICMLDPRTGEPVPMVARAAIEQADVVAYNILGDILLHEGRVHVHKRMNYRPRDYPYVVPVGGKYAIAHVGFFIISGFFGWMFKGLVELYYLLSILPFWKAMRTWIRGLWIFVQNDRLG